MTKANLLPSLARVNELLSYDPISGIFRWRVTRNGFVQAGQQAGYLDSGGHRQIMIDGQAYLAHRLAWWITYQTVPPEKIDHINTVPDDNWIANLRPATQTENARNRPPCVRNTSGVRGVSFHKERKKWVARIRVGKKNIYLGLFNTVEEAKVVRQEAEIQHFREFRYGSLSPVP